MKPTPKCFIDTNVLLYAKDKTSPSKLKAATAWLSALLDRNAAVLSAQSLREYYVNVLRQDRSRSAVAALRAQIAALDDVVPDGLRSDHLALAWELQDRHRVSFWDALLLASALTAGCAIFLSEDMNGGQKIESLTIVNPFATAPEAVLGAKGG
ncbi:MAG: PIN domain-containing protein [Hyphomonadaceae bacterium]|nr:PIN domain-containing protein [Hyphomonadaceae bacterium]